jgi:taurine--2-oxoglutarate transaminase
MWSRARSAAPHRRIGQRTFAAKQMTGAEMIQSCKEHTMFSWSAQNKVSPIPVVKAKGINFWDADGNKWLDWNSQLMCTNIGHGHPKVIQAIKDQADELCFAGPSFVTRVRAEIGPLLAKHTPGELNRFFFCLGGAEANENALKLAKFYTGRHKVLTRYRSYHGATHATMMLTGDPRRWHNEPGMGGVIRAFDPYKYRSHLYQEGDTDLQFSSKLLAQIEEQLMYENPKSVAAIFIETVTGTNGIFPPPEGYLQGIREICDKHGILMVCDEVMAGLGRTGEWFAVDNWKVVPDILTMAKGLTSAYMPLGAVAVNPKIAQYFGDNVYYGGLTYQSHPMCLAASVATLQVMEEEDVCGNSKRMGKVMADLMQKLKDKHPCVGDVRNIGLFGVIELVKNRKTKEPMAGFNEAGNPAMTELVNFLKSKYIYPFTINNLLHCNPPLVINEAELKEAFAIIDQGLSLTDKHVTE